MDSKRLSQLATLARWNCVYFLSKPILHRQIAIKCNSDLVPSLQCTSVLSIECKRWKRLPEASWPALSGQSLLSWLSSSQPASSSRDPRPFLALPRSLTAWPIPAPPHSPWALHRTNATVLGSGGTFSGHLCLMLPVRNSLIVIHHIWCAISCLFFPSVSLAFQF